MSLESIDDSISDLSRRVDALATNSDLFDISVGVEKLNDDVQALKKIDLDRRLRDIKRAAEFAESAAGQAEHHSGSIPDLFHRLNQLEDKLDLIRAEAENDRKDRRDSASIAVFWSTLIVLVVFSCTAQGAEKRWRPLGQPQAGDVIEGKITKDMCVEVHWKDRSPSGYKRTWHYPPLDPQQIRAMKSLNASGKITLRHCELSSS